MKRLFIVDFDGTITREDVCDAMAANYCRPGYNEIDRLWQKGEISTQACAKEIVDRMDATENQLLKLAYSIDVDTTFNEFINYCLDGNDIIWIVSDGYDFYIDSILKFHGWGEIPYYANHMYFKDDKIHVRFPYQNESCQHCGNCKGLWVNHFKEKGFEVNLIGDGFSDICGVKNADKIFAKKSLLKYCKDSKVDCFEYSDFSDIVAMLKNI